MNLKSVSKFSSPGLWNFITSRLYLKQKDNSNYSGIFIRRTTLIYLESLRLLEILVVSRELKKVNFSSKRSTTLKISDMKPWNLLLKKLSVSLLPHFVWTSKTIKGTFLSFLLIREWMNMNKYVIELWCSWRTSDSYDSLSNWYILEIPFVIE